MLTIIGLTAIGAFVGIATGLLAGLMMDLKLDKEVQNFRTYGTWKPIRKPRVFGSYC